MTTFKVDGRKLQPLDEQRVIAVLEGLPLGELLTTEAVATAAGADAEDVRELRELPTTSNHRLKYKGRFLWGSAQTIKAFKKEITK